MKISEITKGLIEQLELEDIEDGCYDGIEVTVRIDDSLWRIARIETTDMGLNIICEEEVK